jgi:uncharacterized membrane protein
MQMPSGYLPDWLLALCNLIVVIALLLAAWRVDKRYVGTRRVGIQVGVVLAALCGLYFMYAGTKPGMTVHWLGVMMTVMMFGPWLALLLLAAVHTLFAFAFNVGGVDALGYNIAVSALLPVIVAALIHTLAYRFLPHNFPVYISKVGVGDLACMLAVDAVTTVVLLTVFSYPRFLVFQDFTLILALMGGMEAVISTWIASLLVCYLPSWLVTFNDEEYIHGK